MIKNTLILLLLLIAMGKTHAQQDTAYRRVANERAAKIVANMHMDRDPTKSKQVNDLIAQHYMTLHNLQNALEGSGTDKAKAEMQVKVAYDQFVEKLSSLLPADQVGEVKNGMTYHTVPLTYANYLLMLPYLEEEQKTMIYKNLLEARDLAVNAGSAKGKHALFNKYKGRIANRLAADGYDLKLEGEWWAKRRDLKSLDLPVAESNRILDSLRLTDKATHESVRNLLAHHYQKMEAIYAHKQQRTEAMSAMQLDSESKKKLENDIWLESKGALDKQRDSFFETVGSWLDNSQIDLVKNEMTKNGIQKEMTRFADLLPTLKEEHKIQLFQYMLEARENALNVLTNRERNQWFTKFRGRANNYLSKEGYDLRQATLDWERRTGKLLD